MNVHRVVYTCAPVLKEVEVILGKVYPPLCITTRGHQQIYLLPE